MNKIYIGLGSNLGDRGHHLEIALQAIKKLSLGEFIRVSSVYETPALMPENAPSDWMRPHYNACCEIEYQDTPQSLLIKLKNIENEMGRNRSAGTWAPRLIDIDILKFGNLSLHGEELQLPHPRIHQRAFVLDPLSELLPQEFLSVAQKQVQHQPMLMGILNASEDSFSNSKEEASALLQKIEEWLKYPLAFIDLGGVSTRPGAAKISTDEEWQRIRGPLESLLEKVKFKLCRPKISVDTTSIEVARRALKMGADVINDVGALSQLEMLSLVREYDAEYVLMHSLSIPADPKVVLSEEYSPIPDIREFFLKKLELIQKAKIDFSKIYLDPGVGFGKSPKHSVQIMKELQKFSDLGCRLLVGHSRKSFMRSFASENAHERDLETIAISLQLAKQGANVLRVHDPLGHRRAFLAETHMRTV